MNAIILFGTCKGFLANLKIVLAIESASTC